MSGGMDSSFAAYMLKQSGYDVVGVTFDLLPKSLQKNVNNGKSCCSLASIDRARKVASDLVIPHYVMDLRDEFEHFVVERFIDEYRQGRTPNPCVLCNKHIKFSAFIDKARALNADKVATGHYAAIDKPDGGYELRKGRDASKDQSYFLYPIAEDLLESILFPLGALTKKELKKESHLIHWNSETAKESQDICFIPAHSYGQFLSPFVPLKQGPVYLTDGRFLGHHNGIHLYTIGQRRGLGIPFTEPLYVVEIKTDENTLILGTKEHLKKKKLIARELNFFDRSEAPVSGRVRYRQSEVPCTFQITGETMNVEFEEPLYAITPGQSIVLYRKERVIGGGVITQVLT